MSCSAKHYLKIIEVLINRIVNTEIQTLLAQNCYVLEYVLQCIYWFAHYLTKLLPGANDHFLGI